MPTSLEYKKPKFFGLIERVASYLPDGDFYTKAFDLVPYSYGPTTFILNTDFAGQPHYIRVNEKRVLDITPAGSEQEIEFKLDRGISEVEMQVGDRIVCQAAFNCSIYLTLYLAMGLEWRWIWTDLIQLVQMIESRFHLTLYETKLPKDYYEHLSSDLSSALTLRNLLFARNHPLSTNSVRCLVSALTGASPHYEEIEALEELEVESDVVVAPQNDIAGKEIHVWDDDFCLVRKVAFMKMAQNLDGYHLDRETEHAVWFDEDSSPTMQGVI